VCGVLFLAFRTVVILSTNRGRHARKAQSVLRQLVSNGPGPETTGRRVGSVVRKAQTVTELCHNQASIWYIPPDGFWGQCSLHHPSTVRKSQPRPQFSNGCRARSESCRLNPESSLASLLAIATARELAVCPRAAEGGLKPERYLGTPESGWAEAPAVAAVLR